MRFSAANEMYQFHLTLPENMRFVSEYKLLYALSFTDAEFVIEHLAKIESKEIRESISKNILLYYYDNHPERVQDFIQKSEFFDALQNQLRQLEAFKK